MSTRHGARLGRFLAALVAALLAVLVAPATASASLSTSTTARFSDAVPEDSSAPSRITYCGGSGQPSCGGSFARVAWGLPSTTSGQTRLDFLPPPTGAAREPGEPFPAGDLHFVNTEIAGGTSIRLVRLSLSVAVVDQERGAEFTAAVVLPLQVDVTPNDGPCLYNPAPPCADAVLLPPAPAVPARYDVGGAVYQLDVLGFANSQSASGLSTRLVGHENADVVAPLMVRVTRNVHLAADAGPDQAVDEGTAVSLDGTGSQGEDLSYSWRQVSGAEVALDDPAAANPTFTAGTVTQDEALEFELTVSEANDPAVQLTDRVVVTVRNVNQPPVLSLPDDLVVTTTDASGAVVTYEATATDPDGGEPAVECTPASGTTFPLGTTTVECTASDGVDEVADSFVVRVNAAPVLQLPSNLTVDATSPAGAPVPYEATATDDEGTPQVTCSPESGATFAIGATTVACTAVDGYGATTTGSFDVSVRGARDQLADLLVAVAGVGPGDGLAAKIRAVVGYLPAPPACETLRAFVNEVQAQSGRHIPADTASGLIEDATRISAVLGCR